MAIIAQGQITIVDLNDAPSLLMSVGSNKTKVFTKTYNYAGAATYNPTLGSGTGQGMEITPALYLAGSNTELFSTGETTKLQFLRWEITIDGTTYTVTPSDTSSSGTHATDVTALSAKGITFSSLGTTGHTFANAKITCATNTGIGKSFYAKAYAQYKYTDRTGDPYTAISADIDVITIEQSKDAYTVDLTNSNHTFPISKDSSGVGTFMDAPCMVGAEVRYGATTVSDYTIACNLGGDDRFTLTYYKADGTTTTTTSSEYRKVKISPKTNKGIGTDTDAITDGGTFTFTITVGGQTFTRIFTWSAAGAGANGADGVSYELTVTPRQIEATANSSGVYSTNSATITVAPSKFRGDAKISWSGYKIAVKNSNGNTWSIMNGTTYTPGVNDGVIEFRLFESADLTIAAGATAAQIDAAIAAATKYVDAETAVVNKKPLDVAYMSVEAGSDPTFRNGLGNNITLTANFYVNATESAASYTKTWKKNGTTISGQTGKTLTVSASDVTSSAYFTCQITYQGKTYIDGVTVKDYTDPYMIELYSTQGTTFLNGVGSTDITCIIRQSNGTTINEIDPYDSTAGHTYTYTYKWYLLDASGNKPANPTYTGKKITVPASAIDSKGTIVCEVSKS